MKAGKGYQGVLRREVVCEDYKYNERLTFVETSSHKRMKRNPHVFEGDHITITRSDDGTYRPNFRPIRIGPGFSVDRYASSVANMSYRDARYDISQVTNVTRPIIIRTCRPRRPRWRWCQPR